MPVHKTISRELTLYTLDEMLADEKLKKNVLDANREPDSVMERVLEYRSDDLANMLEKKGFQEVKIYYDLSYCQGSGACFDFNGCNVLKIASNYNRLIPYVENIKWLFKDWARRGKINSIDSYCDFKTNENSFANHYFHERTRDIEFNWKTEIDEAPSDKFSSDDKLAIDEFQQAFRKLYIDICIDVRNKLRAEEEYYQSDDYTKELLESNYSYCYFYENGTICNEFNVVDNPVQEELNKFISNKAGDDNFIITDPDGKVFCYSENPEDIREGVFLDTSKDIDLGFKKAILFTQNEAKDFIVEYLQDKYDIRSIDKVFIKKGDQ